MAFVSYSELFFPVSLLLKAEANGDDDDNAVGDTASLG